jgi:hypothetical protein
MTALAQAPFRVVSFGDLAGEVWGTVVEAGEAAIVFGMPEGTSSAFGADAVRLTPNGTSWRLEGDGFELLVTPARSPGAEGSEPSSRSEPSSGNEPSSGDGPASGNGDELCHVTGTISAAGTERSVQCVGTRRAGEDLGPGRLDSVRGVSGWFDADRAVTLLAFRPVASAGQEDDVVAATVFEPEGWIAVDDPRLSTTYLPGNRPARASLELWIGSGDEQYPRRAAAEAIGEGGGVDGNGLRLEVTPLQFHTGGLDGTGVYLLVRF